MQAHTTSLRDAQGREHAYHCTPFGFRVGFALKCELLEILSGALGMAVDAIASGEGDALDLSTLGDAAARLPREIMAHGGPELVARILAQTNRERDPGTGGETAERLSDPSVLDRVYAANYLECYEALAWVLRVNYFPFAQAGRSSGWGALWIAVKRWLPDMGAATPATTSSGKGAGASA